MRAVVQRVSRACVTVERRVTGEIGAGLMILLGIGRNDASAVAVNMAEKIAHLRIFEDDEGKNESLPARRERQRAGRVPVYALRRRARAAQAQLYCCGAAGPSEE